MNILKKKLGFTLIEMMVVVLIVGIIAGIIVINVENSRKKGRDARRIADINTIRDALEMYADSNNGNYPDLEPGGDARRNSYPGGNWSTVATPLAPYIATLPVDPINSQTRGFYYGYIGQKIGYKIFARYMESPEGQEKAFNDGSGAGTSGCGYDPADPTKLKDRYELFTYEFMCVGW